MNDLNDLFIMQFLGSEAVVEGDLIPDSSGVFPVNFNELFFVLFMEALEIRSICSSELPSSSPCPRAFFFQDFE